MQHIGFDVIRNLSPFYVWHYGDCAMEIVNFPQDKFTKIAVSGACPHCSVTSFFQPVQIHMEKPVTKGNAWEQRAASICECCNCKQFILVVGVRITGTGVSLDNTGNVNSAFTFIGAFPMGKPNDAADESIPEGVREDFKEAKRCHFIQAYKATVIMCRRVLESSADDLGAKGASLREQIDDLFKTGKITQSLRDFAHHLRMTGNKGAHADVDSVSAEDAADMIQFTNQHLDFVYVMPAKLKARQATSSTKSALTP